MADEPQTTAFELARSWHNNAKVTSPRAMSVQHTQAILDELNKAIRLLRFDMNASTPDTAVGRFLLRHTGAPYK